MFEHCYSGSDVILLVCGSNEMRSGEVLLQQYNNLLGPIFNNGSGNSQEQDNTRYLLILFNLPTKANMSLCYQRKYSISKGSPPMSKRALPLDHLINIQTKETTCSNTE